MKTRKVVISNILIVIMIALFSIGAVLLFSGCNECKHNFAVWTAEIEATCEDDGLEYSICTLCGARSERVVAALGHKWPDKPVNNGNGTHTYICENDNTHTRIVDCVYDSNVVEATCEAGGYTQHTCQFCEFSFKDNLVDQKEHEYGPWQHVSHSMAEEFGLQDTDKKHFHSCIHCDHLEFDDCHFDTSVTKEPTCEEKGFTTHTCTQCQYSYNDSEVDALQHKYSQWQKDTEKPGWHFKVCENDPTHIVEEECALEEITKTANCTEAGYTDHTCQICQYSYRDNEQDAQGHSFGDWQHDDETDSHHRECLKCQAPDEQNGKCEYRETYVEPTCTDDGYTDSVCTVCSHGKKQEDDGSALGHSWIKEAYESDGRGTMTHSRTCNKCGFKDIQGCTYYDTVVDPDCETEGKTTSTCSVCQDTYTKEEKPALGHQWGDWIDHGDNHSATCQRHSEHKLTQTEHIYEESNICPCGHDGLEYTQSGASYYISGYGDAKNVRKLIIPTLHNELPVLSIHLSTLSRNNFLEEVEIGEGFKNIEAYSFMSCVKLRKVTLPSTVERIETYAFLGCTELVDINVGDNVKYLGRCAFDGTAFYRNPENWDNGVMYIGKHIVEANEFEIQTTAESPLIVRDGTLTICSLAFDDCKGLTHIQLPASLLSCDYNAFRNCDNLEKVVYLGTTSQWLGIQFYNDHANPMHYAHEINIQGEGDVTLQEGITNIPSGTFKGNSLAEIVIPESVTIIGSNAFEDCTNLATITIKGNVTEVGADAFNNTAYYNNPANWDGDLLYIQMENGKFLLIGAKKTIETADIKDGTTVIAGDVFKDCVNLKSVTIAKEVQYIGFNAFKGCTSLNSVVFEYDENTVKKWYANAESGLGRVEALDGALQYPSSAAILLTTTYTDYWRRYKSN